MSTVPCPYDKGVNTCLCRGVLAGNAEPMKRQLGNFLYNLIDANVLLLVALVGVLTTVLQLVGNDQKWVFLTNQQKMQRLKDTH